MTTLSIEALMVAIRSIVRDQIRMEKLLEDTELSAEVAEELGDDILQAIKVLGELNDAYEEQLENNSTYPSTNEIRLAEENKE